VADALSHAHAHDVIHRDIKPANVMLVARHALVADFGVALLVQAVAPDRLTESGVTIGTPLYMSPEQSTGQRAVDGCRGRSATDRAPRESSTGRSSSRMIPLAKF
jgi:eukaryotic-like serine/threonine-protein kinase